MYVQIDTLFLADAFDIYTITCLKMYQFDSANFFSAPGLPWQKDQIKSRSFKWYQFVINGIKCIRGGICHSIYQYAKANNKITNTRKIVIKIKSDHILNICM